MRVVMQCAIGNYLLVSVHGHGEAEGETHDERTEGLKTIQPFRHVKSVPLGGRWKGWVFSVRVPKKVRLLRATVRAGIDRGNEGSAD